MSVRDERDIVEQTIRHALEECDDVLVEDHCSGDGTRGIVQAMARYHDRLHFTVNDEPEFDQPATMNGLAAIAHSLGADWIVPMDADEIWGSPFGRLREVLPTLAADTAIATVYEHIPPGTVRTMLWRRPQPWAWSKVAFRWSPQRSLSWGQHELDGAGIADRVSVVVRHFPARSPEQAKARFRRNAADIGAPDFAIRNAQGCAAWSEADFAQWWSGLCSTEGAVFDPPPVRP
jgi:glycosyltransferase involved in cell wall biosynthesis